MHLLHCSAPRGQLVPFLPSFSSSFFLSTARPDLAGLTLRGCHLLVQLQRCGEELSAATAREDAAAEAECCFACTQARREREGSGVWQPSPRGQAIFVSTGDRLERRVPGGGACNTSSSNAVLTKIAWPLGEGCHTPLPSVLLDVLA